MAARGEQPHGRIVLRYGVEPVAVRPYAFASHSAPAARMQALDLYRSEFTPSPQVDRFCTIAAVLTGWLADSIARAMVLLMPA